MTRSLKLAGKIQGARANIVDGKAEDEGNTREAKQVLKTRLMLNNRLLYFKTRRLLLRGSKLTREF